MYFFGKNGKNIIVVLLKFNMISLSWIIDISLWNYLSSCVGPIFLKKKRLMWIDFCTIYQFPPMSHHKFHDFTVNAFMICNSVVFTTGSTDGRIHCWNTETGVKVAVMNADHPGPIQCLQFNPKYMMLASACSNMVQFLCSIYFVDCAAFWLC